MKFSIILVFSSLLFLSNSFAQEINYFHKIEYVAANTKLASSLYKRVDSIKQTRRLNDSRVETLFTRDVDFGYRHQRLTVTFNSIFYQVNLLVKNDTIYLSSVKFDDDIYPSYQKFKAYKIDTINALKYLTLRNQYYNSAKTLNDLKTELDLNEIYALHSGDGYNESWYKKYLDTLVNKKNFAELTKMLKSINCELQTYGVTGFYLLKNKKVKISAENNRLIQHIRKRNSELVSCSGDICPVIWKAYK